jgi:hypothetical protein
MHPIERLRWVARAPEGDAGLVAVEAAGALATFADDPAGLVTACRRLIVRRPECGPLWWLSARVLCAMDPELEAALAAAEIEDDPVGEVLAAELPGGTVVCAGWPEQAADALAGRDPDTDSLVVVTRERRARLWLGRGYRHDDERTPALETVSPDRTAAAVARAALVLLEAEAMGPAGFLAPRGAGALAAAARRAGRPVWLVAGVARVLPGILYDALVAATTNLPFEALTLDLIDQVATPTGLLAPAVAGRRAGCPVAPELLKLPA